MTEDTVLPFDLPAVQRKKVTADYEDDLISPDGGLVRLREAERRLGLVEALAGCIREWGATQRWWSTRCRRYCDALRADPLFKLAVGQAGRRWLRDRLDGDTAGEGRVEDDADQDGPSGRGRHRAASSDGWFRPVPWQDQRFAVDASAGATQWRNPMSSGRVNQVSDLRHLRNQVRLDMPKRAKAWYDQKWLVPTVVILTFISAPFLEDIRKAALAAFGLISGDWFFNIFLTGGLIVLIVILILKSDRATRACEDLRRQLQKDLAAQNEALSAELVDNRKQLKDDLSSLVDTKLKPVSDDVRTLQSYTNSLGSRLDALTSRITALNDTVERLTKKS